MSKIKLLDLVNEQLQSSLEEEGAAQLIKAFTGDAKQLRRSMPGLAAAFEDVLAFSKQDRNQIKGLTKNSPNAAVVINDVDDLLYALKTPGGMSGEVLGLFNQGLLKSAKTPPDLVEGIVKEVVKTPKFRNRYAKLTTAQMEKELKAAGYSDNAIASFKKNARKDAAFEKSFQKGVAKRKATTSGGNKNMNPKGGKNVSQTQQSKLSQKLQQLLDGVKNKKWTWKQVVSWGAVLGIGAVALWWALYDNSPVIPDDTPETEPVEGEWAECIQELINNKEGEVVTSEKEGVSVLVKPDEYPGGLQFYSNGRVLDIANKKIGSWKCKGGKPVTTNESKKIFSKIILEQLDDEMSTDVNNMIDYLDFPVTQNNLISAGQLLKKYVDNGKGKEFLDLYKGSGLGGGDLTKTLNNIYTVNAKSVQAKNYLKQLNQQILTGKAGGKTPTDTTPGQKIGLKNIDIDFGGQKKEDGSTPPTPKPSIYHDCEDKFPIVYGCRKMSKVKEIQSCLGLPEKYQTGNFGPITLSNLEKAGYTVTKESGITEELYNKIKENCKSAPSPTTGSTTGSTTDPNLKPAEIAKVDIGTKPNIDVAGSISGGELKPLDIQPNVSPKSLYDALVSNGNIKGDTSETYLEDGTVLPATNRIKYKGPDLNDENLAKLDEIMGGFGYSRIKQKLDKRYGEKVVWQKS